MYATPCICMLHHVCVCYTMYMYATPCKCMLHHVYVCYTMYMYATPCICMQVQQVACGYDHVIAFVAEDMGPDAPPLERVYSWGRGEEGQLGHNDTYSRCVPKVRYWCCMCSHVYVCVCVCVFLLVVPRRGGPIMVLILHAWPRPDIHTHESRIRVCMYTYINTYIHAYMLYIYIYIYTRTHVHTYIHTYIYCMWPKHSDI